MPIRHSGYKVTPNETYVTPQWVWDALCENAHEFIGAPDICPVDYETPVEDIPWLPKVWATNPPFTLSDQLWGRGMRESDLFAMLLPATWDAAQGRREAMSYCGAKLLLTKRIRWENLEQKKNGPSSNHAWYIWRRGVLPHRGTTLWVI